MPLKDLIPDTWKQEFKIKLGAPHMYWSINNMKRNGFRPRTILDIGAYHGEWTLAVRKIFPDSHFLMIEANPEKHEILDSVCKTVKNVDSEIALLSSESNVQKELTLCETASSILEEFNAPGTRKVSLATSSLDDLLRKRSIAHVDFMKLDVQGYELEVLKGASKCMESCEVILTEVSLIALHKDCPIMADVVRFMDDAGFCAYDICGVAARRPVRPRLVAVGHHIREEEFAARRIETLRVNRLASAR